MAAKFPRRDFFKTFALTMALFPLSYAASVSIGGYVERKGLKYLTDKEAAILEAVGEVIIPDDNILGITIYDAELVKNADELVGVMPQNSQARVSLLLWTVEHVFPLRHFYFCKYSKLSKHHREKVLRQFEASKATVTRALVRGIRGLVELPYYNNPKVAEKIGFIEKCRA